MKLRGGLLLLLLAACAGARRRHATTTRRPTRSGSSASTRRHPARVSACRPARTRSASRRTPSLPVSPRPSVSSSTTPRAARLIIAEDVGQPEPPTRTTAHRPTRGRRPPPQPRPRRRQRRAPTTTTVAPTTTRPTAGLFAIEVEPTCPDGTLATIEITFGNRPDLDGQVGTLTFTTGGSVPLTFDLQHHRRGALPGVGRWRSGDDDLHVGR